MSSDTPIVKLVCSSYRFLGGSPTPTPASGLRPSRLPRLDAIAAPAPFWQRFERILTLHIKSTQESALPKP